MSTARGEHESLGLGPDGAVATRPPGAGGGPALTPGDLAELMAAFNDVTAKLHATHDQLRSQVAKLTAELSEANRQIERSRRLSALGEMAAGIAHEVRNPLGGIALYARMLKDDLEDRPAQKELAEKIARAARGLNEVVGDVLNFSRELRVRAEATELREVVERAIEACCHDGVAGWTRVEIVRGAGLKSGEPAGWITAEIDAGLAHQALVNVVRNAIEAVAEDAHGSAGLVKGGMVGRVEIEVVRREVLAGAGEGEGRREYAVVRVRDTGPGVSEDVIERMFNPFFTTRAAGTGLGLAIVHRIVDAHGGQVRVSNAKPGPGAVFELWFPRTSDVASGSAAGSGRFEPVVNMRPAAGMGVVGGVGGGGGVGGVGGAAG